VLPDDLEGMHTQSERVINNKIINIIMSSGLPYIMSEIGLAIKKLMNKEAYMYPSTFVSYFPGCI